MDNFVHVKLTEWGFSNLIERFEDEGIDKESLVCLEDHDTDNLIPKVGQRAKFRRRLKLLKEEINTIWQEAEDVITEHQEAADCAQAEPSANASKEKGLIKNNEELRIVMVGKTGNGKSASGNTMLGRKAFNSEFRAESVTVDCKKEKGSVGGQKVAVIDTPGLFDTRYDKEKTTKDLSQCISFAAPGPHVFLVIIRLGRFTDEEKKTVEKIQEVFGPAADKYSMVLFTGGDLLEGSIENFLDECSGLKELVVRYNNLYHVFNNKNNDGAQVDELLQKIRNIMMKNGGSHYTNDDFQAAERAVEEEKQRILKEKEETIRKKQEEMERKVQEKYDKQMKEIQEEMQAQREQDKEEGRRLMIQLQEQHDKELGEVKQKIQSMHEEQARNQAEESNPWVKCGQFFISGFDELGKGIVKAFKRK